MALVNGKILKGDKCPYVDKCESKDTACNGEGCPFRDSDTHFCDFSCGMSRFFVLMEKNKYRR